MDGWHHALATARLPLGCFPSSQATAWRRRLRFVCHLEDSAVLDAARQDPGRD
jgi:hypothetical protein